jgi:hypothetical protein
VCAFWQRFDGRRPGASYRTGRNSRPPPPVAMIETRRANRRPRRQIGECQYRPQGWAPTRRDIVACWRLEGSEPEPTLFPLEPSAYRRTAQQTARVSPTRREGRGDWPRSPHETDFEARPGRWGLRLLRRCNSPGGVLRSRRDGRPRDEASPSALNGERFPRTSSRLDPLNLVGTRSTASPTSGLQLGTQWNASLPVPAGRLPRK